MSSTRSTRRASSKATNDDAVSSNDENNSIQSATSSAKRSRTAEAPAATFESKNDWRILRLDLTNFKSYHKQTIGPFKSFQCVIGPNGSGKSNLMDAISFVLGVRASHLRGASLKDLIFNPEGKSSADADRASVELVLRKVDDGDELVFQRSVTSAGTSEYKINGKAHTKTAYDARLQQLNILVKARNFLVFQGDVEAIASKSPKDFTDMLEQISGSSELIEEYNRCLAAKQEAEDNTIFTFQKKKGINAEKKRYKEQKDEAEEFQNLEIEYTNLIRDYVVWQLYHINEALDGGQQRVAAQTAECTTLARKVDDAETAADAGRKALAKAQKTALMADKAVRVAAQHASEEDSAVAKLQVELTHIDKRIASTEKSIDKLAADDSLRLQNIDHLEKDLKAIEDAAAAAAKQSDKLPELDLGAAQVKEYNALKAEAGRITADLRSTLAGTRRELTLAREVLSQRKARVTELKEALAQHEEQVEDLEGRETKMATFVREHSEKQSALQQQLREARAAATTAERRAAQLNEQFDEAETLLREAKADVHEYQRHEAERAVLEDMTRLFAPHVHGRVVDLCKPTQKRYNVAVTVAMGSHMDSIVVDNERTAMQCIQYLKDQRLTPLTFLPLDALNVKPIDEALRQLGAHTRLALDVLTFDERLRAAVVYVVGNALVCDSVDMARRLAFGPDRHNKVIALDGTCIRRSGLISGGLASLQSKAARWNEKKLAEVSQRRDNIVAELAEIAVSKRDAIDQAPLVAALEGLEARLKYGEADLTQTRERLSDAQRTLKRVRGELKQAEKAVSEAEQAVASAERAEQSQAADIAKRETSIFAQFSRKVGVDDIRAYEAERAAAAQREADAALERDTQRARLAQQIEFERSRDLTAPLTRLRERLAADEENKKHVQTQLQAAEKSAARAHKAKDKAQREHDDAVAALTACSDATREEREAAATAAARLADAQKTLAQLEAELSRLRAQRHELFQRCRVEEIDLPISGARQGGAAVLDALPTGSQASGSGMEALLDAEDDVDVDFSRVPHSERCADGVGSPAYNRLDAQKRAREEAARDQLARMAPNLKAIERFEDVVDRLAQTDEVLDAARERAKAATDAFNDVRQRRSAKFLAAYKPIATNIDRIYKELTRGKATAALGTAYLALENTDEPYLAGVKFNAMPPNKVFRDMEQLSGGEKTVAALALLFAIHTYRPSPFFVLDEVDAALDAVNVSKVANYIRSRSRDCQFVVISLKDDFFKKADALAGIYRDETSNSSHVATLDLTPYAY